MGERDNCPRATNQQGARWRQYAPWSRRIPGATLAQRERMGLYHQGASLEGRLNSADIRASVG